MPHWRRCKRRGLMVADVAAGFSILIVLAVAFAVALAGRDRAARKLANTRAATRLAERAMVELQSTKPLPAPADGERVEVQPVDGAPPATGKSWVQVRATVQGQMASLYGAVPAAASAHAEVHP
jgi:hypothetical protein